MGLMDKIRDMAGLPPEEGYYEDIPNDYVSRRQSTYRQDDTYEDMPEEDHGEDNKFVNMSPTMRLQVVLVKPTRFEEASTIADHLNNKCTVVLNLESASKEVARRLVDFLSGVAYANNGEIQRVANSTFIITQHNVSLMGDLLDELENNGVTL